MPQKVLSELNFGNFLFRRSFLQFTWYSFFVEGDGNDVIDGFQRYEADGEARTALRMYFGRNIPAPSADGDFQITFACLAGINCAHSHVTQKEQNKAHALQSSSGCRFPKLNAPRPKYGAR
jgi:hypothetical protein